MSFDRLLILSLVHVDAGADAGADVAVFDKPDMGNDSGSKR
jgi:hypothetical protein